MIDPRRLTVLRALADHGTVRAAAETLYLTPSAVSQQLTALEQEAGQALLTRRGRRVELTAAGELLAEHAKVVLAEVERAEASMAAHATGAVGRVGVASFASAITRVVAPCITALRSTAPGVTVLVRDAEAHDSLLLLLSGETDVAISMEYGATAQSDEHRLTRYPLYTEPFDAVLPPHHPLCGRTSVGLADIGESDWIAPLPGNPCREVAQTCFADAGFAPRITHTSDDFHAVVALVAAGTGVALVPRSAIPAEHGAAVRPLHERIPTRRVFAAVRRGREEHPLLRRVLDTLLGCSEEL
ncbi:DNA-binding transcriptional regulator, LysR family [Actinopolyspora xinjiangensis]|uniref:DNA-binding transcriptional regulator, LysR family n=1 Tax=Actinopolyspora xinjiangensis TaxID=405564 RepID=A0A1H0UYD7_9ACTN|nr:LysR family transcriptional regulator [Actinopolyspora xinjiangensis]SDP70856.1 DNA-binding transcriptional regulator, LysR family [Actinopolyspora xinjiangensis]